MHSLRGKRVILCARMNLEFPVVRHRTVSGHWIIVHLELFNDKYFLHH